MEVKVTLNMWPDLLASFTLLTLTAYHLMIYWGRKKDREGLYSVKFIRILYWGYLLLTFNMLIYCFVELINSPRVVIPYHYLTVIILYIFTYAFSVKFNKEHDELKELKRTLKTRIGAQTKRPFANHQKFTEIHHRPMIVIPSKCNDLSIDEQFLRKAMQIIEENINETNFNAEKFCKEIGISRAHLYRKLKALTNQSATEFIRTIRLKRAAELLNQKAASVSEIAYRTGFNNLSYFTRRFKEEFGVVPSEYFSR